jgi:hypothetical protein
MSFRMRGRVIRTARNAAIWLLIISTTSSALVMGATTRREARRAKRNGCCPQQPVCAPCDVCSTVQVGEAAKPPSTAPPDTPMPPAPVPGKEPESSSQAPVPPSPEPPPSGPSGSAASANDSPPPTPPTASSRSSDANHRVIVTDEAPPEPKAIESDSNPFASFGREENRSASPTSEQESDAQPVTSRTENDDVSVPVIEPPRPANGGSRYQEYLDRYFDRKKSQPATSVTEEEKEPAKPIVTPTPPTDVDEPPTLSPSKPAKQYNDPFRPTSYRDSYQRTWRDPSGEHRIRARFLGVDDRGMAQMEREDGRLTRIPLANLSREDLRFIELLAIREVTAPPQAIAARPKGR